MLNSQKRVDAMTFLRNKLQDVIGDKSKCTISGIRMNFWTIHWLFEDIPFKIPVKEMGDPDWPHGACCALGSPYDTFVYVDNSLCNGVWEIDYGK